MKIQSQTHISIVSQISLVNYLIHMISNLQIITRKNFTESLKVKIPNRLMTKSCELKILYTVVCIDTKYIHSISTRVGQSTRALEESKFVLHPLSQSTYYVCQELHRPINSNPSIFDSILQAFKIQSAPPVGTNPKLCPKDKNIWVRSHPLIYLATIYKALIIPVILVHPIITTWDVIPVKFRCIRPWSRIPRCRPPQSYSEIPSHHKRSARHILIWF